MKKKRSVHENLNKNQSIIRWSAREGEEKRTRTKEQRETTSENK